MGIKLIVEVLDHAPADLTSSELVVLLVLAEYANEGTRRAFGDDVTERLIGRSRLSRTAWTKTVYRLRIDHGIEIRDVVAKRDDGGPVYAYKGLRTSYRLPYFADAPAAQRVDSGPLFDESERVDSGPPIDADWVDSGPPFEPQRVDSGPQRVDSGPPHTPHTQVQELSSSETASRPDVERVCAHLRERIIANGSKPHLVTVTKAWRDAARLMIDRDERSEEQIMRAIDWCQDHTFWRANIRSMPKLREQYETLRLQAERERKRAPVAPPSNAPDRIAPEERCPNPDHRGQRKGSCSSCAADRKAARRE